LSRSELGGGRRSVKRANPGLIIGGLGYRSRQLAKIVRAGDRIGQIMKLLWQRLGLGGVSCRRLYAVLRADDARNQGFSRR